LGFVPSAEYDFFLLGDVLLNNYYSIHDHTNAKLGLAIHTASELTKIEAAVLPELVIDIGAAKDE
jgi:hypothetical protein